MTAAATVAADRTESAAAGGTAITVEEPGGGAPAAAPQQQRRPGRWRAALRAAGLGALLVFVAVSYAYCNPLPAGHFDYQLRIATALLHGRLGITDPVSWLSELIPAPDRPGLWYSAFPLGSILTFLPVALVKAWLGPERFTDESVRWVVALVAAGTAYFLYKLSSRYGAPLSRRLLLVAFALFGTWLWTNLAFGAAWNLAVAIAALGEAGALWFLLRPRPLPYLAGLCFAVAYGNRTEILLTAPIFLYLILRKPASGQGARGAEPPSLRRRLGSAAFFTFFPTVLGIATAAYNWARFGSVTDFGYTHIPGLMNEPWFRHGFYSLYAVPMNAHAMLLGSPWRLEGNVPYLAAIPDGGSIFASSPYLLLLFRDGWRDRGVLNASWLAVGLLTAALWVHGNNGGWQFSYRYGVELIPWFFVVLTENSRRRIAGREIALLVLSVALNAWATYQFYWTDWVHY